MSVAVSTRDLWKTYQDATRAVEVLRGVDLEAPAGELTAIVGPSGSGKSTLLHLLGTLDRPDRGTVRIGEVDPQELPARELASFRNATIGFVFQFHRLLPDFTAWENVMLPARIAGRSANRAAADARRLLVEVGLEGRLDHHPPELSGGERQRVALCRALVNRPSLLLADEPTGNLDPVAAEHVFELLLRLQAEHGTTAILVTHNPELARRCASIRRLERGRLEIDGAPEVDPASSVTD